MTPPTPTAPSVPASAPIAGVIVGAALTAIEAIQPYATGANLNWPLMAATFLVVFAATVGTAVYHVQLPSPVQQMAITGITQALDSASQAIRTPQAPPTVIVQQPAAVPAPIAPVAAVSTDVPTA